MKNTILYKTKETYGVCLKENLNLNQFEKYLEMEIPDEAWEKILKEDLDKIRASVEIILNNE